MQTTTLGISDEIYEQFAEYSASVAIPPYFADTLPRMPVIAFYDRTMGPDALALQYIEIPLDVYIPKIFTSVSIADGGNLDYLSLHVIYYTLGVDPTCTDMTGWTDSWGDGCEWYKAYDGPGCYGYGDSYTPSDGAFSGISANDACCYCKF